MKVSVVIPALNEAEGIAQTIKGIEKLPYETEVVVVDNGSTDDTAKLASQAGAVVVYEPLRGYGNAYRAGFKAATGDVIVTGDADGTYPLDRINYFVELVARDVYEFITTNRFLILKDGAMSKRNIIGNAVLSNTMQILFGLQIRDSQSGMWIFQRDILPRLKLTSNTPLSQEIKIEACHFAKCRWLEVPIDYRPRLGQVKLGNWKVGMGNLAHLFVKRVIR